ncbi:hypothetical protein R1sor_010364 [Riccia sorocarpa]|uniref:Uncharacterized protein n=1 Tax=Riccia sorocarpa TaxID=122646 RepID=A0ABD3HXS9_9MARC
MQNRPTLFDLWREFRYFADVTDRKYLSHLEFFLETKAGRFFGAKKSDRRPILLSSLVEFEEEIKKVREDSLEDNPQEDNPTSFIFESFERRTAAKVKMGPCKPIAWPTTELKKFKPQIEDLGLGFLFWRWDYAAEPLMKEFATTKSDVALPHRGKPHEWTVEHYRKMLGRSKEQEEPGIVWDTMIQRLNMPEGVNPDDIFQEEKREGQELIQDQDICRPPSKGDCPRLQIKNYLPWCK